MLQIHTSLGEAQRQSVLSLTGKIGRSVECYEQKDPNRLPFLKQDEKLLP